MEVLPPPSRQNLVCTLNPSIVEIYFPDGIYMSQQEVNLVRVFENPIDPNLIMVVLKNWKEGENPIGYLERRAATFLSPHIDSGIIRAVCTVDDPVQDPFTAVNIPCKIKIYRESDSSIEEDEILNLCISSGLRVILEPILDYDVQANYERNRNIDGVFATTARLYNNDEDAVLEPSAEIIKTELLMHQKTALAWMIKREKSGRLPPFWEQSYLHSYVNELTNQRDRTRPAPLNGGILADDKGLGKTLTLLSLIATDNRPVPPPLEISNTVEETSSSSCKKLSIVQSGLKVTVSGNHRPTTLIVCSSVSLSSWINQIEENIKPGTLDVYLLQTKASVTDINVLIQFDIILTTNAVLKKYIESPICSKTWWRVILDDAHLTKIEVASVLRGERKWAVTGEPIHDGSFDLFSIMYFLGFYPFNDDISWKRLVKDLLKNEGGRAGEPKQGLSRLQALLSTICLRRTKFHITKHHSVDFSPKSVEDRLIAFSDEERRVYDSMELYAKILLTDSITEDNTLSDYKKVLQAIFKLRDFCESPVTCADDLPLAEDGSQHFNNTVAYLQDSKALFCPICQDSPTDPVISSCFHVFCSECIQMAFQHNNFCCSCRAELSEFKIFPIPAHIFRDHNNPTSSSAQPSSSAVSATRNLPPKVSALIQMLVSSRNKSPSIKCIVFSYFRRLLVKIEKPLRDEGFDILRLDKSMSAKRKSEVIKEFSECGPHTSTIILVTLSDTEVKMNLTAASEAYLLERSGIPDVEEQAMNIVCSIGKKKSVKVIRLIMKDSIEEGIVDLQRKKILQGESFGKKRGKLSVDDLKMMMRM